MLQRVKALVATVRADFILEIMAAINSEFSLSDSAYVCRTCPLHQSMRRILKHEKS